MPKYKTNVSFLHPRNINYKKYNYIFPQITIIYFKIYLYYNYIKCRVIYLSVKRSIETRGKRIVYLVYLFPPSLQNYIYK